PPPQGGRGPRGPLVAQSATPTLPVARRQRRLPYGRSRPTPASPCSPAPSPPLGAPSACPRDRRAACSALPCGSSGRRRARWRRCGPRPARLARCCWPTSRPSSGLSGAEMPFAHQLRQWHPVVGLLAGPQRLGQERLVAPAADGDGGLDAVAVGLAQLNRCPLPVETDHAVGGPA